MDEEVDPISQADYEALLKLYGQWERECLSHEDSYIVGLCRFAYLEGARAYQSLQKP